MGESNVKGNRLIVVLGMHRSGTSALTRGLMVMGADLGSRLMPSAEKNNDKGFWEDLDINALNVEMLLYLGGDWQRLTPITGEDVARLRSSDFFLRAVETLRQKIAHSKLFAFKDPRVAILVPFWREVFAHCKCAVSYVLALRHPLSVAKSLAARDGMAHAKSYLLWLSHTVSSLTSSEGSQRVLVDYDQLMKFPRRELGRIGQKLGLELVEPELAVYEQEYLDSGLRHTSYEIEDLQLDLACPVIVQEVYAILTQVALEAIELDSPELSQQIEHWCAEVARLSPVMKLVDQLFEKEGIASTTAKAHETEISNLSVTLKNNGLHIAGLERALGEKDVHIGNLEQVVVSRDAHITGLEHALHEKDAHIGKLEQVLVSRDGDVASVEQTLHEKVVHIGNLEQVLVSRDGHIAGLEHTLHEKDAHIRNLEQVVVSRDGHITGLERTLLDKDAHIGNLEQVVVSRDGHIAGLEHKLQANDQRIGSLEQVVVSRDGHIAGLERTLQDKDARIGNLEQVVVSRDGHIAGLEHKLQENDERIGSLEQVVVTRDRHITGLERVLLEKEERIGSLEQAVVSCDGHITSLERTLGERAEHIAKLGQTITSRDERLSRLDQVVRESELLIDDLKQVTAARNSVLANLNQLNQDKDSRIEGLVKALESQRGQLASRDRALEDKDLYASELRQAITDEKCRAEQIATHLSERDRQLSLLKVELATHRNAADILEVQQNSVLQSGRYLLRNVLKIVKPRTTVMLLKRQEQLRGNVEFLNSCGLFDEDWYLSMYPDIAARKVVAVRHYLTHGVSEGRDPNSLFDTDWYLEKYPDVAESGMNPLIHFVSKGASELRDPSPLFSTKWYVQSYLDNDPTAINPLLHYLTIGAKSGFNPNPLFFNGWYVDRYLGNRSTNLNPLRHYIETGVAECCNPNPLFHSGWYLQAYPDVAALKVNPLHHYLSNGALEGRNPNPVFDTGWYLRTYPDIASSGMNPLQHYLLHGTFEGRDPSPMFSTVGYLLTYDDVWRSGINPLVHYLDYGMAEGRLGKPPSKQVGENAGGVHISNGQEHHVLPQIPISPKLTKDYRFWKNYAIDKQIDIIVCVHNALDDLKRCLESVTRFSLWPCRLIVVDDGSQRETASYLHKYCLEQGALSLRNEKALGYTFAANQGLRASSGEYVVLLNSDTVVTQGWIEKLVACVESDSRIGIVGPLSNTASWQSVPDILQDGDWADNELPSGMSIADMGRLISKYADISYPRIGFINGFCMLIRRELIHEIGYFDEEAFGKGYGEENDYCIRARVKGWKLAVADNAYVYHAQSKSYSHERRKMLAEIAGNQLFQKHGGELIEEGVASCRKSLEMVALRAHAHTMLDREANIERGRSSWEGRSLLFVLPVMHAGGGANVVITESMAMLKMGIHVAIANLSVHKPAFDASYPDLALPVHYFDNPEAIPGFAKDFDCVVATANTSVEWIEPLARMENGPVLGYYIQDFEPNFYDVNSPGYERALQSYSLIAGMKLFTKTEWNRREVLIHTGLTSKIIGPSYNNGLFRPQERRPRGRDLPIHIVSMYRPSTPRRNPVGTLEIMVAIKRKFGSRVVVSIFGAEERVEVPLHIAQSGIQNYGQITIEQAATLFSETDIFIDMSHFQAMGLTAMEAMASGAVPIVPTAGGANSFAVDKRNAFIVDTADTEAVLQAIASLVENFDLLRSMQEAALTDIVRFHPEGVAVNILDYLFGAKGAV